MFRPKACRVVAVLFSATLASGCDAGFFAGLFNHCMTVDCNDDDPCTDDICMTVGDVDTGFVETCFHEPLRCDQGFECDPDAARDTDPCVEVLP